MARGRCVIVALLIVSHLEVTSLFRNGLFAGAHCVDCETGARRFGGPLWLLSSFHIKEHGTQARSTYSDIFPKSSP
jgi:hypothetical protein